MTRPDHALWCPWRRCWGLCRFLLAGALVYLFIVLAFLL